MATDQKAEWSAAPVPVAADGAVDSDEEYLDWLRGQSMLLAVREIAARFSGRSRQWSQPYAQPLPRAATEKASAWFTAYPGSIITREGDSVLATLCQPELWKALTAIGLNAIHTGPTKLSGGLRGREHTPSIDGHFDRIGLGIDPAYGSQADFFCLSQTAADHGAVVIDDIIPAHTGKGADFRLAERADGDAPGLYHMVEIPREDWGILPEVPHGADSVNLGESHVQTLQEKGYIVGRLYRTIFLEPGVKETDWSATAVVRGVDGVERRWVYLHYFKDGQPALNWLDPSFAAPRLVLGDALHALDVLKAKILRLDANGFLGIERGPTPDSTAWSEGHPLSVTANQFIASMIRKAGGFSFQELNLAVDDIARLAQGGPDLSYDFISRPAYQHALVTGETEFLRLMLQIQNGEVDHARGRGDGEPARPRIDPASLVHALQNHDELTLELVHFLQRHRDDPYPWQGGYLKGSELREAIRGVMYERLTEAVPYNLRFTDNGVACTTASLITAALGITDLDALDEADIARIQQVHLLLAMFNALQPGVFAISGWDLVGALPLHPGQVAEHLADGDTRWIERGAYDLMGLAPEATRSHAGLPRARALYGSLPEQLGRPDSFARQLQRILGVRQQYRIFQAQQFPLPPVTSRSLLVLVHELPVGLQVQVTALNFGPEPVDEVVQLAHARTGEVVNLLTDQPEGTLTEAGDLRVMLGPYEGKPYLIRAR